MSASAAGASSEQDWLALYDWMSKAEQEHKGTPTSTDVLYSYETDDQAHQLGRLLMKLGVDDSPRYVQHLSSKSGSSSALCDSKTQDIFADLAKTFHGLSIFKDNPQGFLSMLSQASALGTRPVCDRFGVLLSDAQIIRIESVVKPMLLRADEESLNAHRKAERDFSTALLLQHLIDKASRVQTSEAGQPSGIFYAFDTKERATRFSQTLQECGVVGGSGRPKYVAQHCQSARDQRFGVILTDSNLVEIETFKQNAFASKAASRDFVVSMRENATRTFLDSGDVCYNFRNEQIALATSRSLLDVLKIAPKDVVLESGYFIIKVTASEEERIGGRISFYERMTGP